MDTYINKLFKDKIRKDFLDWFDNDALEPKNITAKGYVKPPSCELMIHWLYDAWNHISPDMIEESFKYCGLTGNKSDI